MGRESSMSLSLSQGRSMRERKKEILGESWRRRRERHRSGKKEKNREERQGWDSNRTNPAGKRPFPCYSGDLIFRRRNYSILPWTNRNLLKSAAGYGYRILTGKWQDFYRISPEIYGILLEEIIVLVNDNRRETHTENSSNLHSPHIRNLWT